MMVEIPVSLILFAALLLGTFSGGLFMYSCQEGSDFWTFIAVALFLIACVIGEFGYSSIL